MSKITKQDVEHVANLARLSISEEDQEKLTNQLDSILSFAEKLNQLDTDNVEPTSHVLPITNVTRVDRVRPSVSVDDALKNTAEHAQDQFKVPSIIES